MRLETMRSLQIRLLIDFKIAISAQLKGTLSNQIQHFGTRKQISLNRTPKKKNNEPSKVGRFQMRYLIAS
jgi:hypothetical protein